jgi:hypothetical protein
MDRPPYHFESGANFSQPRTQQAALKWIDKAGSLKGWATSDEESAAMFLALVGLIQFRSGRWYLTEDGRRSFSESIEHSEGPPQP